jgi:catechol 2,3-dioxygenase-like lactoylglutathione lyase family enzyme
LGIRIGSTVVNVTDLARGIDFWAAALGYVVRDGQHDDDFAVLVPPGGGWSNLSLQLTDAPKGGTNRLHLDLYADDQAAEMERLLGVGAGRPPWDYPGDADFVVLADPDGNEFCVVDKGVVTGE